MYTLTTALWTEHDARSVLRSAFFYPSNHSFILFSLLVSVNDAPVSCLDVLPGPGRLALPAPDLDGVGNK